MDVAACKVVDEEEVLTRNAPPAVEHEQRFFELRETLATVWGGGFADVPGVCGESEGGS